MAMGTILTVFGVTQPGIKPKTYQFQGGHSTTGPQSWFHNSGKNGDQGMSQWSKTFEW